MFTKILLTVALLSAISTTIYASIYLQDYETELFDVFKVKYNRKYTSYEEEQMRKNIFKENIRKINNHQESNPYATFEANQFADMNSDEFKIYHNAEYYYSQFDNGFNFEYPVLSTYYNHSINWTDRGVVTEVKNQGQCGSCWSFSTTGNIEGQWAIKTSNLVSLSEQELVSCSTYNDGCNGGNMDNAFVWLLKTTNGWISSEMSCPYVSGNGYVPKCNFLRTGQKAVKIIGYKNIPNDEKLMSNWLYKYGPISIGVDASSWQFYSGGIMTNCVSNQVDHGVLLVGFDDFSNPPYWIIKNSWGPEWGEKGYIRVAKWSNQCLLTSTPSTSLV